MPLFQIGEENIGSSDHLTTLVTTLNPRSLPRKQHSAIQNLQCFHPKVHFNFLNILDGNFVVQHGRKIFRNNDKEG